ncbi:hypothetical protein [Ruminococcus flavefaciens]|uniref:hypothetical protein n=1 Tax=Ruminococcus flavefaciens TaxID=1265 RepID=UPI0026F05CA7|nr:hypothetical protein [Ruminococcus flavefaciens]MDD7515559.1 hypothetical protein [Ruminococcus flavefaciens]MDY5692708.1 hypothetical protein [Ruminococcus flavefaciens]
MDKKQISQYSLLLIITVGALIKMAWHNINGKDLGVFIIILCIFAAAAAIFYAVRLATGTSSICKKLGLNNKSELAAWKNSCRIRYEGNIYVNDDYTLFMENGAVWRTTDIMEMRDYTRKRRSTGFNYNIDFTHVNGNHAHVVMNDKFMRDRLHAEMEQFLADVKQIYRSR